MIAPGPNTWCSQCASHHESAACPNTRPRLPGPNRPAVLTEDARKEHAEAGRIYADELNQVMWTFAGQAPTEYTLRHVQALAAAAQVHFLAASLTNTPWVPYEPNVLRSERPLKIRETEIRKPWDTTYRACGYEACWCWQTPGPDRRTSPTHLSPNLGGLR